MTNLQLQYQQNLETIRSNKANEAIKRGDLEETIRSNLAREKETNRSNVAREMEDRLSHRANEAENTRTHMVNEGLSLADLVSNYGIKTQQNLINVQKNAIEDLKASEAARHNRAAEFETTRHNAAVERNDRIITGNRTLDSLFNAAGTVIRAFK